MLFSSSVLVQHRSPYSAFGHRKVTGCAVRCDRCLHVQECGAAGLRIYRSKSLSESSPAFFLLVRSVIAFPLRIPLRFPPPTKVCPCPPLASLPSSSSSSSSESGRCGRPSPTWAPPAFESGAAASEREANWAEAAEVS